MNHNQLMNHMLNIFRAPVIPSPPWVPTTGDTVTGAAKRAPRLDHYGAVPSPNSETFEVDLAPNAAVPWRQTTGDHGR